MNKHISYLNRITFNIILLLITACSSENSDVLQASNDTTEVIITTKASRGIQSVVPFGRSKLITIFKPRILKNNQMEFSYKMENELKDELVMLTAYTEGNIAASTTNFYYSGSGYNMSNKKISFFPRASDWISGRTKVRLYFVANSDLDSMENKTLAVSNVITFFIKYSNGVPIEIEL
ncbi:hypothetical protein ACFL4H_01030 [Candidatus Neomarinimicrobiota bacterium]